MNRVSSFRIFLFLFCLLAAIGAWFLIVPQAGRLALVQSEAQAVRTEASEPAPASAAASRQQAFLADAAQAQELLPAADGQYDLVTLVESAVRSAGLPLNGLSVVSNSSPSDPPTGSLAGLGQLDLAISTEGSYQDIEKVIDRLGQLGRYLSVSAVSLSGSGTDAQLTAQITASAYYLPKSS